MNLSNQTIAPPLSYQSVIMAEEVLDNWMRYEFNLSKEMLEHCEDSFLRVWTPDILFTCMEDGILHHREDWIIHWQSHPSVCRSAAAVGCSFRKYRGKRYVVVKVWEAKLKSVATGNKNDEVTK